ncbi:MAG: NapC/NirT family cytochrome c [Deltaproteobacteria bacterium]|nr:NapC/NirT family cytochrome c [Deltaproteobacteria bacterium]
MKPGRKRHIGITLFSFLAIFACFLTSTTLLADPPTVSILSPSDGIKIYTTGTADYPVKIVFKTWDQSDGIKTSGTNAFMLYWQQGVSSGSFNITTSISSWGPVDTATDLYRSYDWIPTAGSGIYAIQVQATDNAGAPSVGKSRKIFINVSTTALNNFSGFPGDGKLLVRDNDNTICMSCHAIKAHSSADISSTTYGNWERVCRDCHTPHNTRNIFLLQSSFKIYTGINQAFAYRKKVDFRNLSGESAFGFVTESGKERRGPCEVCHTRTRNTDNTPRWRNYTSEPDADGQKHNAGLACTDCHLHVDGFKPGESGGDFDCSGCHADLFNPMNSADDGYHHFMDNGGVDKLISSDSKYPLLTDVMGDATDKRRRCLMCHVDHDIFRKEINPLSKGRGHNLRPNISVLPTLTSGVNTDFLASNIDGGICLSCHKRSQTKSYTQPDGTTHTPIINKTLFLDSPHNYEVEASFNSSAYKFKANCSKCHIDTINKTKQTSGNQFGPHYSVVRKINAVTTSGNNLGTVSASTDDTLVDDNDPIEWADNIWQGRTVRILEGTGAGQSRYIKGNILKNTLQISPNWTTNPDSTSIYLIGLSREVDDGFSTGGNTTTTLRDRDASWITNFWVDRPVTIVKGTGYGQTRQVMSNTSTTLTISGADPWDLTPDTTSKYSLGDPSEEEVCYRCHSEQTNPYAGSKKGWFNVQTFDNSKVLKMEELFYARGELQKASGSGVGSITAAVNPGWSVDQWAGQKVRIVAGRGVGQEVGVDSNTNNQLYLLQNWTALDNGVRPDNTSTFFVGAGNPFRHRMEKYFAKHRSDEAEVAPDSATSTGWFNDPTVTNGLHSGCQDCHNPHGNRKPGDDNGIAESGSTTHLRDSDKSTTWTKDMWRGYTLRLMDGTGRGQDRMITFNTTTSVHVGAPYVTASPGAGTYYIISPNGTPDRGNKLWNPNSGTWGVNVTYQPGTPPVNTMRGPTFTKNKDLIGGTDKVYQLCFKCHSEYGWGTSGTPFTIPDSIGTSNYNYKEGPSTDIAEEFNPNNLGYHPIVDIGANQPILVMGDAPVNVVAAEMIASGAGSSSSAIAYDNQWTPNKYNGQCVEVTAGNLLGQIRSIKGSNSTSISVDPAFSAIPNALTRFHIRKCSIYNVGAGYSGSSTPWPRFTKGTINLYAGNSTVTINGLSDGIPSTVIKGWYIYAGELRTGINTTDTPRADGCSATAPCPPMLSTKGWYQIVDIAPGASDPSTGSVDLVVSPAPASDWSGSYALTSGLGNTFVPPYGPWSVIACPDCHDTDDARNPSGPHASSRQWILRTLETQSFPWYYGGINSFTSTTTISTIKTVSYPDGGDTGWGDTYMYMPNYTCLNCHRPDVYGSSSKSPVRDVVPSGSAFDNYSWQYLSRVPHVPSNRVYGTNPLENTYGISCMSCHGGDNRPEKGTTSPGSPDLALGGIHGSNLGVGRGGTVFGGPTYSLRGRRLLNGAAWNGVTRASTSTGTICTYGGTNPDAVSSCLSSTNRYSWAGAKANYPYFSGGDAAGTSLVSAEAANVPPGNNGPNSGDRVIITFSAETNGDTITINSSTINSILDLGPGKSWLSGDGQLGGGLGVWSTATYLNDTLTITLSDSGGMPSVRVGDTITLDGTILGGDGGQIIDTITITGNFDVRPMSAVASDINGGGPGIQEKKDRVTLIFDDQTAGTAINGTNIDSALVLNNDHTWKEGPLGIYSSGWSSTNYPDDTLTITLNNMTSSSAIDILDTITLDGVTIKDVLGSPVTGSFQLVGSFDSMPDGVVGFWKLEESSGTTVYDESPYDNKGVRIGATQTVLGRRGRSYSFDGSGGDRIEVADSNQFLNLTSQASIEFWMKRDAAPNNSQVYVEKNGVFTIQDLTNTGRISFTWNGTLLTTPAALENDRWYHIVATYDGANMYMYVNGDPAAGPQSAARASANSYSLFIGSNSLSSFTVKGLIDEVLIYNKSLSPTEIRDRYGAWLVTAAASDTSGQGAGIQEGDEVIITFDGETNGLLVDENNISSALLLSAGHTWKEGIQGIYSSAWRSINYANDTLVITLNNMTSTDAVASGDKIHLNGTMKDSLGRSILDSVVISGDFDIPYGALGYWKFDEASGSSASDSTFYNNSGTLAGGTWTNTSYSGYAIDFSSSSTGVNVTDYNNSLDLKSSGSLEVWARKNSNADYQTLMAKGSTAAYRLTEMGTGGKLTSRWGQPTIDNYSTDFSLPANAWNHIVLTYNGGNLLYYVNGESAGGGTYSTDAEANNDPLWIGHRNGAFGYDGILDEVIVYEKVLDLAEIRSRYKVKLDSADAAVGDNTPGIQANDQVVIRFKSPTAGGTGLCTDTATINTILDLDEPLGTWGPMSTVQCVWSSNPHSNDTLTVRLETGANVGIGDTITLGSGANAIRDTIGTGREISGSVQIGGTFGTVANEPVNAVAHWKLDGISGAVADATANGNDGSVVGVPTRGITGRFDKAFSFDFDLPPERVAVPDSNSLDLTRAGTVEMWINKSDHGNKTYLSKGDAYSLKGINSGEVVFTWANPDNKVTSPDELSLNEWHHIVGTYDGTSLKLYVDGKLVKREPSRIIDAAGNTNILTLASDNGSSDFYGIVDEVVIYNRAIDELEVEQRYGAWLESAVASDATFGGTGIQTDDEIIISFDGETNGDLLLPSISAVLGLSSGSWGSSSVYTWSNAGGKTNDTLTITLTNDANITPGTKITLDGTIKDTLLRPIIDSIDITGGFDVPAGAVAYWKFDEGSGATIADSTFHNHTGTASNTSWTNTSYDNYALGYNGSNSLVSVNHSPFLNLTTQGSLEVWVKRNAGDFGFWPLISKGTADGYEIGIHAYSGLVAVKWGNFLTYGITSATALQPGVWNHIVATYNGNTDELKLYINGKLDNTVTSYTTNAVVNSDSLKIGDGAGINYSGIIDEALVYNDELILSEVEKRFKVKIESAEAIAVNNAPGIQAGDQVIIRFRSPAANTAVCGSISASLALNSGSWGTPSSCIWTNSGAHAYGYDTLTITLPASGATVGVGDTITLGSGANAIKDTIGAGREISGSIQISGTFGTNANEPLNAVGYWKLESNGNDSTVNNNHGVVSGGLWTPGRYGQALDFERDTSDNVSVPDANSLDLSKAGSVEAWIRKESDNAGQTIVSKGSAFSLYEEIGGKVSFQWATAAKVTSNTVLSAGKWYHVAGTYDGSAITIYINGQPENSISHIVDAAANNNPLTVGNQNGSNYFDGVIDELVVYNRSVTAPEVLQRYGAWPTSAVASDPLPEASGIQADDKIVITFDGETNGDIIGSIPTALGLNGGGWGSTSAYMWSNDGGNINDTLTITLTADADIGVGDTITLQNGVIKDTLLRAISASIQITGTFGTDADKPVGAVGHWSFDETAGTVANDLTANNNNGTAWGSTPWFDPGRYDRAFNFDGSANYVEMADKNSLDLIGEGSIELWIYKDGYKNNQVWVNKGEAYGIRDNGVTGQVVFWWGSTANTLTSATLSTGEWHHVVATYDGTDMYLYIDKNPALTVTGASTLDAAANGNPLRVGVSSVLGDYFDGRIDEVAIYNKALTFAEAEERYGAGVTGAVGADSTIAGAGLQGGDKVLITFNGMTNGSALTNLTVNSALNITGKSWLDGNGDLGTPGPAWTSTNYSDDTLAITLGDNISLPDIAIGDTIDLDGTIKDQYNRGIRGSVTITGTFDVPVDAIAYWRYDDSGYTVTDETDNNLNGTSYNGGFLDATWTTGKIGSGLAFDGNDYVDYGENAAFVLASSYAIEAWIKPTSFDSSIEDSAIFFNSDGAAIRYNFSIHSDGKIGFSHSPDVNGSLGGKVLSQSTGTLTLNEWNHVVVTRSGKKSASTAHDTTFYINGTASGTFDDDHYDVSSSINIWTGKSNIGGDNFFKGVIDEVVVFNRSLSASEVKTRRRTWMESARAKDLSAGGYGIQANDQVVITFNEETNGPLVNSNIDSILVLNNGHSWLPDGGGLGGPGFAAWSTVTYPNDTLHVVFNNTTGSLAVAPGDVITISDTILDGLKRPPLNDRIVISGSFASIPAGATAFWKFDEALTSGDKVIDATTNNNHGSLINTVTRTETSHEGRALSFDGINNYVEVPGANLNIDTYLRIDFWIKAGNQDSGDGIITSDAFEVNAWSSGELEIRLKTGTEWEGCLRGVSAPTFSNSWHHVEVTWDGSLINLVVDGTPYGPSCTTTGSSLSAATEVRLGTSLAGGNYFNGMLDEVIIFNQP